jgi:hypothetical protein
LESKDYEKTIRENIDFILSHFEGQHELFPRAILTGEQKIWKIIDFYSDEQKSKDIIFESFQKSGFIDCRINAFPHNTQHRIDFDVKNKTAPTFIMIDLDSKDFENEQRLVFRQNKIIKKFSDVFNNKTFPTVLHTGNGYHIYQPIQPVKGRPFERFLEFYNFLPYLDGKDLTTEFMRFAEKYISEGKADQGHTPSIKNCMVRVPGTFNSKNGKQVTIEQRWNGIRPPIQYLTREFQTYLIQKRINKIKEQKKLSKSKKRYSSFSDSVKPKIGWIERLLETPIEDYRKTSVSLIIVPYLLVVKNLDEDSIYDITKDWIQSCSGLRKVDLDIYNQIKYAVQSSVRKKIPPMKIDTIKTNRPDLHALLVKRKVLS